MTVIILLLFFMICPTQAFISGSQHFVTRKQDYCSSSNSVSCPASATLNRKDMYSVKRISDIGQVQAKLSTTFDEKLVDIDFINLPPDSYVFHGVGWPTEAGPHATAFARHIQWKRKLTDAERMSSTTQL